MLSAEKVLDYELDGGGDGNILTNGIKAEAAGTVAIIIALSELDEPAIFMLVAAVSRGLQTCPARRARSPPDVVTLARCSEHTLMMLNQCLFREIE